MKIVSRCIGWQLFFAAGMALLALPGNLVCTAVARDASTPGNRPSPVESLRSEIVPDDAPARPPYLPARYDLGLSRPGEKKDVLEAMTQEAADRQERLHQLWVSIRNDAAQGKTQAEQADAGLLAYAFGEAKLDDVLQIAKASGPESQFRLARLLMMECRFNDALQLLAALADLPPEPSAGKIPRQALALLAQHDVQRAALEKHISLVPLDFGLHGYLARREQDQGAKAFIESVRKTTAIRLPDELRIMGSDTLFSNRPQEPEDLVLTLDEPEPWADWVLNPSECLFTSPCMSAKLYDLDRLYLAVGGPEFMLYQEKQGWISGERAHLTLSSEFNGPIHFRLYRFSTREDWQNIRADALGRSKPERTWTQSFQSLECNNQGRMEWPVQVDELRSGYFLLTAEARYAPMLAACKFCVCNVSVYLRTGSNQAVAVAVDRRDGRPVPRLPLSLHITGEPDADLICQRVRPAVADAFLRGFRGSQAELEYATGPEAVPEPPWQAAGQQAAESPKEPSENANDPFNGGPRRQRPIPSLAEAVREAESYAQGVAARREWPDFKQIRPLRTDDQGCAAAAVDLNRREYRYTLDLQRADESSDAGPLSHLTLGYREPARASAHTRAVVWLAQPVSRPGGVVDFAGIVRQTDGAHLADHLPASSQQVVVCVVNRQGPVWKGPCDVSPAGMFHGRFRIPPTIRLGPCWFKIDGERAEPNLPLVVEEFRLATYQVGLSLPRRIHVGGENMEGQVSVVYFTGKPAEGAEVEVALECVRLHEPVVVKGTTGPDGLFHFSLPLSSFRYDAYGILRATVTDVSGQSYTRMENVRCAADAFQVNVTPSQRSVASGTVVQLGIEARTWSGEPIPDAIVTVDGVRQTATTDRQGNASLPWTANGKDAETVRVTVAVAGKAVHASSNIYPCDKPSDGCVAREDAADALAPSLEIVSFKAPERLNAGETLECALTLKGSAEGTATVAIFAERERLLASRVLVLTAGEHHVAIPTAREWAPGAELVAVLVDDRRSKPHTTYCYLNPRDKLLTLEIQTDKAEYRPGDRCAAVVKAVDHRGRPVPGAEISLGVVDDALYQVREDPLPDLFRLLYEQRLPDLCVGQFEGPAPSVESLSLLLGPRYAWGYYPPPHGVQPYRRLLGRGGGTMQTIRSAQLPVRRHFETAAHWVADLVTGADGTARTLLTFPDNITSWRFTARGVTADTRVGDIRVSRRTLLPLAVDLALPRGFRVGDSIDLPVVLSNHADKPRQVRGTTRVGQAQEQTWADSKLTALGQQSFTIPVTAANVQPIEIVATVRDIDGNDADAVRRPLVPLPRLRPTFQAWSGPLTMETSINVNLEAEKGEKLKVVVCREPGLAGAVQSALEDLVQYPYGCVEQTMSRFMPAVIADETIRKAGLRSAVSERLPDVVGEGFARLASLQHADGGWGWWKDDETNDFMTAYVLEGLARCQRLVPSMDPELADRASRYLLGGLKEQQLRGRRPDSIGNVRLDIYAAHALALALGQDAERNQQSLGDLRAAVRRMENDRPSERLLDRLLLTDMQRLLGDRARALAELETLSLKAIPKQSDRASIFAAAATLELGLALAPEDPRWQLLARQLVAARTGSGWGDTLTSSAAVRGLAAAIAVSRAEQSPIAVHIDGRQVGVMTGAQGNRIELKLPRAGTVSLRPAALPCEDFYQIRVEGVAIVRDEPIPDPSVTIRTGLSQTQPAPKELDADSSGLLTLARGKTYEMQIEVEFKQPVSFARLTLPRPCGMELVRLPPRTAGVAAIEGRDDAIHFFIDHWEAGRHRITFPIRAEVTGTILAPPPELSPMYGDSLPTAVAGPRAWNVRE